MGQIEVSEFDERLNSFECSQLIRDIVGLLRQAATQAGVGDWRAHSTPGRGWGITGRRGGRVFCRFDPKPAVPHICVSIPDAHEADLMRAGVLHRRKNAAPWVDISNVQGSAVCAQIMAQIPQSVPAPLGRATRSHATSQPSDSEEAAGLGDPPADAEDVRKYLAELGFARVGTIRPLDGGRRCAFVSVAGVNGAAVYGLIVDNSFKKAGDTGRKNATLAKRMNDCADTINKILRGELVGPFTEHFKARAPSAITANCEVEVWAREATREDCSQLQRHLNRKFETIRDGWANRLE